MDEPSAPHNQCLLLETLATVDAIVVVHDIEMLEVIKGTNVNSVYKIYDANRCPVKTETEEIDVENCNDLQQIMLVKEDRTDCQRMCCGNARAAALDFINEERQTVMTIHSKCRCLFFGSMDVSGPSGEPLGRIIEKCSLKAELDVTGEAGQKLFKIKGPGCICGQQQHCGLHVNFEITSTATGNNVGTIQKQWGGAESEAITDPSNTFSITFHDKTLQAKEKALLLGALFQIDFTYFEYCGRFIDIIALAFIIILVLGSVVAIIYGVQAFKAHDRSSNPHERSHLNHDGDDHDHPNQ